MTDWLLHLDNSKGYALRILHHGPAAHTLGGGRPAQHATTELLDLGRTLVAVRHGKIHTPARWHIIDRHHASHPLIAVHKDRVLTPTHIRGRSGPTEQTRVKFFSPSAICGHQLIPADCARL